MVDELMKWKPGEVPHLDWPDVATTCPLCSGDGWYNQETEPSDVQIDELSSNMDILARNYAKEALRKRGATIVGLAIEDNEFLFAMRATVREWLAKL